MKYRAEIDGLRAVAVVPVILFHAGFSLFSGGFVGVDVFFVLSGYLITSLLIEDLTTGKFSFSKFYERRARRILPALITVTLTTSIIGWFALSPLDVNKLGNGLIGVATFSSNFIFWLTQGYFVESAELNPLIHTWSLAVEEQYYFIFPIILYLGWKLGVNKLFAIIFTLSLVSLIASEFVSRNNPLANFYFLATRAWELFAGSLSAYVIHKNGVRSNQSFSLLGLLCIITSILIYDKSIPFPSAYSLLPVVGTVLIILFADSNTYVAKFLKNRLLVGIGLISYSAYLWHQPLFAFARIQLNTIKLQPVISAPLILTCIILAYLSWKYVETPFRNKERFQTKTIFVFSLVALTTVGSIGLLSKNVSANYEQYLAKKLSDSQYVYFSNLDERKFTESRLYYPLKKTDILIVGSSRVMGFSSSLLEQELMNLSVSGASIEDIIAYAGEGVTSLTPKHIFIGADPWLFNIHDQQDRWRTSEKMYKYWSKQMMTPLNINADSFYSSHEETSVMSPVQKFYFAINKNSSAIALNDQTEPVAKKAYDGSHIYNETYIALSPDEIEQDFSSLLLYSMGDYSDNQEARTIFRNLIQWLKLKGIDTTLVLTPYHPKLFQMMVNRKPIFLQVEEDFRRLSDNLDIDIIGSYNPNNLGCGAHEFYDGMHPKKSCLQKMFTSTPN